MATEVAGAHTAFTQMRRWPRYKLNVPLRVVVDTGEKVRIIDGRGTELNEGGMRVFAGVELKVGNLISIEFTPPYSGEPVRVRSEVRNRSGYTYGIEFLQETAEDCVRVEQIRFALQGLGQREF